MWLIIGYLERARGCVKSRKQHNLQNPYPHEVSGQALLQDLYLEEGLREGLAPAFAGGKKSAVSGGYFAQYFD